MVLSLPVRVALALAVVAAIAVQLALLMYLRDDIPLLRNLLNHPVQRWDKWIGKNDPPTTGQDERYSTAGNATLGFQTVQFINLDHRYDLKDAMVLQALVSGLNINTMSAVDSQSLEAHDGVGEPPSSLHSQDSSHSQDPLKASIRACLMSHKKLWNRMISEGWETMLVLEADAAWDVNIRNQAQRVARGIEQLIGQKSRTSSHDPWNSAMWDVLMFGPCNEHNHHSKDKVVIDDPDGPAHEYMYNDAEYPRNTRVVRRMGGPVCTNAYAISRQGALKMLLRTAIDVDNPVDIIMHHMAINDELKGYSMYPTLFGQWEYKDGIGADELNSDIDDFAKAQMSENSKAIWKDIHDTFNVWKIKPNFAFTDFQNPALGVLGEAAFGVSRTRL